MWNAIDSNDYVWFFGFLWWGSECWIFEISIIEKNNVGNREDSSKVLNKRLSKV